MKILALLLVSAIIISIACSRDRQPPKLTAAIEPNSWSTVRDRDEERKTVEDRSDSEADRTISQKIRGALTADESLSTNAKNVKIISNNGMVTLRGPVKNEQEKSAVEAKTKQVPGVKNVDNQLEVGIAYGKTRFA